VEGGGGGGSVRGVTREVCDTGWGCVRRGGCSLACSTTRMQFSALIRARSIYLVTELWLVACDRRFMHLDSHFLGESYLRHRY
jgi:hypothetical protein